MPDERGFQGSGFDLNAATCLRAALELHAEPYQHRPISAQREGWILLREARDQDQPRRQHAA